MPFSNGRTNAPANAITKDGFRALKAKAQPLRQEIRALHGQRLSDSEIARRLGISVSHVNGLRTKMDLPKCLPNATLRSKFTDDELRALHAQVLVDRGWGVPVDPGLRQ